MSYTIGKKMKLAYSLVFMCLSTVAFSKSSCLEQFVGTYGVKEMPRDLQRIKKELGNEKPSEEQVNEILTYDGFPFLVTHSYLRTDEDRGKSLPKNTPLFTVEKVTGDKWHFKTVIADLSKEQFWGLNATDGRDLDKVTAVDDGESCYLEYGTEGGYEPRRLAYIDTQKLSKEELATLTEVINSNYFTAFTPAQMKKKKYFLIGSLSSQSIGGEYPFFESGIIFPVDKLK